MLNKGFIAKRRTDRQTSVVNIWIYSFFFIMCQWTHQWRFCSPTSSKEPLRFKFTLAEASQWWRSNDVKPNTCSWWMSPFIPFLSDSAYFRSDHPLAQLNERPVSSGPHSNSLIMNGPAFTFFSPLLCWKRPLLSPSSWEDTCCSLSVEFNVCLAPFGQHWLNHRRQWSGNLWATLVSLRTWFINVRL